MWDQKIWFALAHFLLGVTTIVIGFTKIRGFEPLSTFDPHSGSVTDPGSPDDDDDGASPFAWGDPVTETHSNVSVSFFIGAAALIESVGLFLFAYMPGYKEQAADRLVPSRWTLWAITQSLAFVALSYICGISNIAVIFAVVIATISLNFAQSTNEALHCGTVTSNENRYGFTIGYKWSLEGYLVATLSYVFIVGVSAAYLFNGTPYVGASEISRTIPIVIFVITYAVYFVLHVCILLFLTNFPKITDYTEYREFFFHVAQAVMFITIAIGTYLLREYE